MCWAKPPILNMRFKPEMFDSVPIALPRAITGIPLLYGEVQEA